MSAPTPHHFTVITLPAYKAEGTLEQTIGALPAGTADHLLLVDDASPDGTVHIARRLGIDVRVHDRNRGYGANQKTCYREALDLGATVIVLLHPDYQYDPSAVPALVAPILAGVADFTFGLRFACTGNPRPRAGACPSTAERSSSARASSAIDGARPTPREPAKPWRAATTVGNFAHGVARHATLTA